MARSGWNGCPGLAPRPAGPCPAPARGGTEGILLAATETLGQPMPLIERLQRLVKDVETPIVAFARDGLFVGASNAARALPGFPNLAESLVENLAEAGLDAARGDALENGSVELPIGAG